MLHDRMKISLRQICRIIILYPSLVCGIYFNVMVSYALPFFFLLAVLGLRCCASAFSSCSECGLLFVAVCSLLIEVASFLAEHRL